MQRRGELVYIVFVALFGAVLLLGAKAKCKDETHLQSCPSFDKASAACLGEAVGISDVNETGTLSLQVAIRVPDYVINDSVSVIFSDTLGNTIYTNGGQPVEGYAVDSVTEKAEFLAPAESGLHWVGFEANPIISTADTFTVERIYAVYFILSGEDPELVNTEGVFALFGSEANTGEFEVTYWTMRKVPAVTEWGLLTLVFFLIASGGIMLYQNRRALTVSD